MAIDQREFHARFGKVLPDELKHQQFVEIRVQQRPYDRIQFPVMVMRAFREVDDHGRRKNLTDSLEDKGSESGLSSRVLSHELWCSFLSPQSSHNRRARIAAPPWSTDHETPCPSICTYLVSHPQPSNS